MLLSNLINTVKSPLASFIVALCLGVMVRSSIALNRSSLTSYSGLCNDEFHKECHCGSIAISPSTSLFTRIAYPNSTIVIEEYDEEIPYGYKYLRVYYRCTDENDVLVGNNMRECSNGNWIGRVPRCAINNLNRTKLKQTRISDYKVDFNSLGNQSTNTSVDKPVSVLIYYDESLKLDPNGSFEIPLDNQPNECLRWSLSPRQIWSMKLSKQTKVHYVRIKLYGDHIEDLYLNHEISIEMSLKNISYFESKKNTNDHSFTELPIEINCRETIPKASQFETYQQKYSANYLVLDFLCEIESKEKSIFEFLFSYDYEIDQLYVSVIEIKFQMLNIEVPSEDYSSYEFRQKIFVISLCELKTYSFNTDCGMPDIPVTAIVQRDYNYFDENVQERKSYKYICNDKNQELKGNPIIECAHYGKWNNDFPKCVPSRPCDKLNNVSLNSGYKLDVKYETTETNKHGKEVIPNGKFARFSCIKVSSDKSEEIEKNLSKADTTSHYPYKGMSQIICQNGEWIGLESANPNCIDKSKMRSSVTGNVNPYSTRVIVTTESMQVVSLPVRVIQILSALFVMLCLIIVSLLIYMVMFRKRISRANSMKESIPIHAIDLSSDMIPAIVYNTVDSEYSGAIYSSVNDLYERISLGQESHLYHTIKSNTNNGNYSDMSTYSDYKQEGERNIHAGEERVNSIYGFELDLSQATETLTVPGSTDAPATGEKEYNQLSRSSSINMKMNSIYES